MIVARALAQETPVLLWHEPVSHLDVTHQLELYRLARTLAGEGRTVVMVCHDLFLAPIFVWWCDQKRKGLCGQKRNNESCGLLFVVCARAWHED